MFGGSLKSIFAVLSGVIVSGTIIILVVFCWPYIKEAFRDQDENKNIPDD